MLCHRDKYTPNSKRHSYSTNTIVTKEWNGISIKSNSRKSNPQPENKEIRPKTQHWGQKGHSVVTMEQEQWLFLEAFQKDSSRSVQSIRRLKTATTGVFVVSGKFLVGSQHDCPELQKQLCNVQSKWSNTN